MYKPLIPSSAFQFSKTNRLSSRTLSIFFPIEIYPPKIPTKNPSLLKQETL